MEDADAGTAEAVTDDASPTVTVRYWAAARAAAGCDQDVVRGSTVGAVLAAVRLVHQGNRRFSDVLAVSSLLLGEQPLGTRDPASVAIRDGDTVEVLPPFAGG